MNNDVWPVDSDATCDVCGARVHFGTRHREPFGRVCHRCWIRGRER